MSTSRSSCDEAIRRLALYIDGELEPADQEIVERHIETCRSCFSRLEFERRLKRQIGTLRERHVDQAFEGRIRRLIAGFGDQPAAGH